MMAFNTRFATTKTVTLISGCLLAFTSHGQALVDPELRPYTLAPYVLESSNLEPRPDVEGDLGGTYAYRPWFENGAWTGDLIKYRVDSSGSRVVRNDIGHYPRDGNDWRGTIHPNPWSARYAFKDWVPYDLSQETAEDWVCEEEDPLYYENRNLWTFSAGVTRPLTWSAITPDQREIIDAEVAADEATHEEPFASGLLNFARGDRSDEACKGGNFRMRYSLLGAVINSRPVFVPRAVESDPDLVVVGANAGMLHGFDAQNGSEVFGYVPSMLLGKLGQLPSRNYKTYFVDGELRHKNIQFGEAKKQIVAGGLGLGGKGLFILDVSSPQNPEVLHELSGMDTDYIGGSYHEKLGYIQGRPTIAKLPSGPYQQAGWYAVFGNGYDSDSDIKSAHLVLVPLENTSDPIFIPTDGETNNGLSAPALLSINRDDVANFAYAGDLKGRMWRFDFKEGSVSTLFDAGPDKPITTEPDIAEHPKLGGHMVYFGTGSLLNTTDLSMDPAPPDQSVFGIWDRGTGSPVIEDDLVNQTLTTVLGEEWDVIQEGNSCSPPPTIETNTAHVRIVPNQQDPIWSGQDRDLGWRVDLPSGERVLRQVQVRAERVQFTTINPADVRDVNEDAGAGSWMMQLDMETGASPVAQPDRRALFDLNKNCVLDQSDTVEYFDPITASTDTYYPLGINLGPYHIAHPAFARVRFDSSANAVVDGVYINALQLPMQDITSPPVSGPIDVMTNVPSGSAPLWHQYDATDEDYPGRGGFYPEPAKLDTGTPQRATRDASGPIKPFLGADGPGNRVDGHSSGYNKVHGVPYIDFVQLEPRRGDYRLDVGSVFEDTDESIKPINPRKAKQELYRATEVVPPDQRFIVVLANADLSQYNEIRIGCRTWPVYDYQTMIMPHLRAYAANGQGGRNADLSGFVDENGDSLVVTLADFFDDEGNQRTCSDDGQPMTLRITPTDRVGLEGTLMGTLPGCVNNTHLYSGQPKMNAETATASELYDVDPHVTPNQEGEGYRWRNGALTVQLLAVSGNLSMFELQNPDHWPEAVAQGQGKGSSTPTEGTTVGFGGAYAVGFDPIVSGSGGNQTTSITPSDVTDNGLLYESSIFWHWSDMLRFQSRGSETADPNNGSCYAGTSVIDYRREFEWFLQPAYDGLTADFSLEDQMEYARLLYNIENGIDVANNITQLQELFTQITGSWGAQKDLTIGDYHRMRVYVLNNPDLNLIELDRGLSFSPEDAGTPIDVIDIERDLLPSLGPNYQPGRRSWMDITPELP